LFAGKFHPLAPNLPGEPCPIHGNGFSSAWDVEAAAAASVELSLNSSGHGVFRYTARASYALRSGALTMGPAIVN
jgi:aldose 1-epimerase